MFTSGSVISSFRWKHLTSGNGTETETESYWRRIISQFRFKSLPEGTKGVEWTWSPGSADRKNNSKYYLWRGATHLTSGWRPGATNGGTRGVEVGDVCHIVWKFACYPAAPAIGGCFPLTSASVVLHSVIKKMFRHYPVGKLSQIVFVPRAVPHLLLVCPRDTAHIPISIPFPSLYPYLSSLFLIAALCPAHSVRTEPEA